MRNILLIAQRELSAYLRNMNGYVILAVMLFIDGLLFNAFAVSSQSFKRSSEIVADFFTLTSGITMIGAVFLSMRLIAEERQTGTVALLYSSPVFDLEIVLGKFFSALAFLGLFFVATLYMPILIAVYGKVAPMHIAAGYFGLFLVGAMSLAIGIFGSSVGGNQVVAAVLSGVMLLALTTCWILVKVTDRPLTEVVAGLSWWLHFDPFRVGLVHLKHISYFALTTFLALFATTRVLEARRWK